MNELAKQLIVNAGKVDRYQNKQHMAGMTSHYFNGIMIGVSLCFFVSPDNSRGEWILFLLATMGFATCIWLSSRWQRQINALADEGAMLMEKMVEAMKAKMEENNAESN